MIQENISLKNISTFKIGGNAQYYTEISNKQELEQAVKFAQNNSLNITPLGSASNVIISDQGIKGLVIRFSNKDIQLTQDNDNHVLITAGSGVIWDDFVNFCVNESFYGVENLSYIPGTVGASAVQNIGAYGQEVCSTIKTIHAYDTQENKFVEINNKQADFSYRKSIFNTNLKGRYIILEITYKLAKAGEFSLGYQDMAYFRDDQDLSLTKVRDEIIKIRINKLPDYNILPNVGSFFKNIVLEKSEFNQLVTKAETIDKQKAEKLHSFATSRDQVKVPTALLIDLCGLKGYKQDHIGIYEEHALIVVNHSKKGTCQDVLDFSDYVSNTIQEKLGVTISREPTVIN